MAQKLRWQASGRCMVRLSGDEPAGIECTVAAPQSVPATPHPRRRNEWQAAASMCHTVKTGECDCRYLWDAAGGARASACVLTRTIKGAGASPSIVHSSIWRDRLSALGNGEAQSSEGTVYLDTSCRDARIRRGHYFHSGVRNFAVRSNTPSRRVRAFYPIAAVRVSKKTNGIGSGQP